MINNRRRLGGYYLASNVQVDLTPFHVEHFPTSDAREEFISIWGGIPHDSADNISKPWLTYFDRNKENEKQAISNFPAL